MKCVFIRGISMIKKSDFPVFHHVPNSFAYLDNASTTFVPQQVVDALTDYYTHPYTNVHRGIYNLAEETTIQYEQIRKEVATFINAREKSEVVFTKGTTDGLNMAARLLVPFINKGDEILITQAEHHAHFVTWQQIALEKGAHLRIIPVNPSSYTITNSCYDSLISSRTKVVAVTASSNVFPALWGPESLYLWDLLKKANAVNAFTVIDGAQYIPHMALQLEDMSIDFCAFSTHKMGGPTGLGILYIRKRLHDCLMPVQFGGGMIFSVTNEESKWARSPQRFEAGTPPIAQVKAFGALLKYWKEKGSYKKLSSHYQELMCQLYEGLQALGMVIYAPHTDIYEGHVLSWSVPQLHAHDAAHVLGMQGCYVRAGDHCAQPLHHALRMPATLRASFFWYTTREDIEHLLSSLEYLLTHSKGL